MAEEEQEQDTDQLFRPADRYYGLEVQKPFSELILTGKKSIETRSYPLPSKLLYRHVLLIESEPGADGVSQIGSLCKNNTDDPEGNPRIVGSVVFSECFEYECEEQWRQDEHKHCVPRGSYYDWHTHTVAANASASASASAGSPSGRKEAQEKAPVSPLSTAQPYRPAHAMATTAVSTAVLLHDTITSISQEQERANHESSRKAHFETIRAEQRREKRRAAAVQHVVTYLPASNTDNARAHHARKAEMAAQEQSTHIFPPKTADVAAKAAGMMTVTLPTVGEKRPPNERRYGWRIMGVFRAPVSAHSIPTMMRMHRSLFECGSSDVKLPAY